MDIQIKLSTILYVAGAIVTLAAAYKIIHGAIKKYVNKLIDEALDGRVNTIMDEKISEIEKSVANTLEAVNEVKATLEGYIVTANANFEDIKKTLCDSLREKITTMHKDCIKAGYISEHQMYIVNEWWDDYHNRLNGNSFVEGLVEDLRDLYKEYQETDEDKEV